MASLPPNHPTRRNLDLDRNLNLAAAPGFVKLSARQSPRHARGGGGGGGGGGIKGWFACGRGKGGVLSYLGLEGAIVSIAIVSIAYSPTSGWKAMLYLLWLCLLWRYLL